MASLEEYVCITLFSVLGLVCTLSNGLVCYIITKRRAAIGALNFLVLSLALTDILIGSVCVPMFVSLQITFSENSLNYSSSNVSLAESRNNSPGRLAVYITLNCFEVYLSTCSILHLCFMALDRVLLVTKPFLHRGKWASKKLQLRLSMIPWLFSSILATVTVVHYTLPGMEVNVVAAMGVFILIPCVFLAVCYTIIFMTIRRRNRKFSQVQEIRTNTLVLDTLASSSSCSNAVKLKSKNPVHNGKILSTTAKKIDEMKMIKTLLCIIVVFFSCWFPLILMNIITPGYSTLKGASVDIETQLGIAAKFFHYSNSACNPFIYSFFNPAFKASVISIFKSQSPSQCT